MVMNMTMTYDGTMVMPKNFAVVTEDEMTYVDGGWYKTNTVYFSSAASAYKELDRMAWACYCSAFVIGISAAVIGFAMGGEIGAGIGAIGGIIAGCIVWGWGSACDNGAIQAKQLGTRSCRVTYTLQNFTMNVSVA
jgi:hypothetical protein